MGAKYDSRLGAGQGAIDEMLSLIALYQDGFPAHDVYDVEFEVKFRAELHDRAVLFDNGWTVKIGRGLDFYQKPTSWFGLGMVT